jgi:hypothetical protein
VIIIKILNDVAQMCHDVTIESFLRHPVVFMQRLQELEARRQQLSNVA